MLFHLVFESYVEGLTFDVGEGEASIDEGTLEGYGGLDLPVLQSVLSLPDLLPPRHLLILSEKSGHVR